MKFNKKALLVGAALILGMQGAAHAVSPDAVAKLTQKFEFFNQLPKDLQMQIIGLLDAGSFEASMKQLANLRLVNKQMRDLIDNEYTGKQIIDMLAQNNKIINDVAQRNPESALSVLVDIVIKQNLPSSFAWLKEQAKVNPKIKEALANAADLKMRGLFRETSGPLNQDESNALKKLLTAGAGFDFNDGKWTLLMTAASQGDIGAAQVVLDAGADINQISPNQGTALDIANNIATKYQQPPAYFGTKASKEEVERNKEFIEFLKSRGAKTAAELSQK